MERTLLCISATQRLSLYTKLLELSSAPRDADDTKPVRAIIRIKRIPRMICKVFGGAITPMCICLYQQSN